MLTFARTTLDRPDNTISILWTDPKMINLENDHRPINQICCNRKNWYHKIGILMFIFIFDLLEIGFRRMKIFTNECFLVIEIGKENEMIEGKWRIKTERSENRFSKEEITRHYTSVPYRQPFTHTQSSWAVLSNVCDW